MIVLVLPEDRDDDRLLRLARGGSQAAIIQIYEQYYTPIFHYIRLRTGDALLAEDLSSEVFTRLVAAFRGKNGANAPRAHLRGWLFRVARNLIIDQHARAVATTTLEEWVPAPGDDLPEAQFLRALDREQVVEALAGLNAEQQEVLILRFGQALNLQETADIMGKSVSAIKSLQFRAVDGLRQRLGLVNGGRAYVG
jgi:RNA polymerase sigma-70 factor (ECF subfamily)